MHSKKARLLACLCAAGVASLAVTVSPAAASDASIKKAIRSYNPRILVAEGHLISAIGEYRKTGNAEGVESALSNSISVFRALKSKIGAQSARAPRVKRGKSKLLKGISSVILAYQHLKVAFAVKAANPLAAHEQAEKAEVAVHKGRKELREGTKLLK